MSKYGKNPIADRLRMMTPKQIEEFADTLDELATECLQTYPSNPEVGQKFAEYAKRLRRYARMRKNNPGW